jgi:hypothetical protein
VSKFTGSRRQGFALGIVFSMAAIATSMLMLSPVTRRGSSPTVLPHSSTPDSMALSAGAQQKAWASYAALPLGFEANEGQTDPQVRYLARANGYTVFLTEEDAVFSFANTISPHRRLLNRLRREASPTLAASEENVPPEVVNLHLVGGNPHAHIAVADVLPGKINYFIGNDSSKWYTGLARYGRIAYESVYPGVDLAYHGDANKLEFDFVLAPQSDPAAIAFTLSGAQGVDIDATGNLVVRASSGDVVFHKPMAYQRQEDGRETVDARFVLRGANQVGFQLGSYDRGRQLVIDPSVNFATYLGGKEEDDGYGIALDGSGNAYITGQTESTNFPTKGGIAPNHNSGSFDVFVTELSADGSTLIYSTYIGGSGKDSGNAIAVDSSGDAFVTGGTASNDFPTTGGVFQKTFGTKAGSATLDAFVLEVNAGGSSLGFSTFLGGNGDDVASGIAIDASGEYVVGSTASTNFPVQNPEQPSIAGSSNGFVTKLNTAGSGLVYSTYLGGGDGDFASAVAVNSEQAYVVGAAQNASFPTTPHAFQQTCKSCSASPPAPDVFVTVFNTNGSGNGSGFVYSTFLGGSDIDQGLGVAVDASGDAYVTGLTESSDFPLQSAWQQNFGGTQNAFVAQLNPGGTALVYSTYLGGTGSDGATGIVLDSRKNAYLTGQTSSNDFPLSSPTQLALGGGNDAFVSEVNPDGLLIFSTYLGGSMNENTNATGGNLAVLGSVAVDNAGTNVYVTGNTLSTNFPTVAPEQASEGGNIDAFVAKYALPTGPDFAISATVPAPVSPGVGGTSTVDLIALNGYNSAVNLSCKVSGGGTPAPTCSASSAFSTNPVTPSTAGATSTLTITTSGNATASLPHRTGFYATWLPIAGLTLLGISFSSAGSRKKRLVGLLMIGLWMSALCLMPACTTTSTTTITGGCTSCTASGSYNITITGTGADANATTHSTQVTFLVN